MLYEKKIKYLDYIEHEENKGTVGFWKIVACNDVCNMILHIKDLLESDTMDCPVYLIGCGKKEKIAELRLVKGCGNVELMGKDLSDLGGTGISYNGIDEIEVDISEGKKIRGFIHEKKREENIGQYDVLKEKVEPRERENENSQDREEISEVEPKESETGCYEDSEVEPKESETGCYEEKEVEPKESETGCYEEKEVEPMEGEAEYYYDDVSEEIIKEKEVDSNALENEREAIIERLDFIHKPFTDKIMKKERRVLSNKISHHPRLHNNKWEQLWEIYPHVTPFRDEREYLSFAPEDFVVLSRRYFPLANNSFLLHGYYNYKHVVIKRDISGGEETFYLGVPGVFFEREKQVAILFGFESFECLREPAGLGEYGYYMKKIEL